jgi:HTH-type transcriptional regulator/antitoxin HigA
MALASSPAAKQRRLQRLVAQIEDYERRHHPVPPPSHAGLLEHLLDAREIDVAELAKATGVARGDIKEILARKRPITPHEGKQFARYFAVDVAVFLEPETQPPAPQGSRRAAAG